jgi:methylglutamate dehydrogenase subunit B
MKTGPVRAPAGIEGRKMRINCPWCGPRPLSEFTYGGDATVARPKKPDTAGLDAWMEYVYLRENPAGRHKEYWHHGTGCRSWIIVTRDTTTHEIEKVALASPQMLEGNK